ncbi:MAG: phosphate/phosphite/phosphonate ABC transporter substrate-binding protein [Aquificae bacterium]|nr:phosphate/phosphite/phosphonate ABC transporter substrate-binding protein [Aquificota bacterium]
MKKLVFFLLFFSFSYGYEITFAVLSSGSMIKEYKRFKALSEYITQKTGIDVNLKIIDKYQDLLDMYKYQKVDLSISCPVVFYKIKASNNVEGIAVVKIDGMVMEAGVIVVRKDSPIHTVEDLRGAKITLGSSICASNCVMPLYILSINNITYEDVSDMWSSGSDKAAILAVLAGLADAAGVKEESALLYIDKGIRILAKSPYVPRYVVALSKDLPLDIQKKIKNALYSLKDKKVLEKLGIDGFERPKPDMFKLIKNYNAVLGQYPLIK